MDDKLKWILLAAGAYFLYDRYAGGTILTTTDDTASGADAAARQAAERARAAADAAAAAALRAAQTQTANDTAVALAARQTAERARAAAEQAQAEATARAIAAARASTVPATSTQAAILASTDDYAIALNAAAGMPMHITESERRGLRYDYYQWNWFREKTAAMAGQQAPPDPGLFARDPSAKVLVSQYLTDLARGTTGGMSGLGWAPILPFNTAWSA